MLCGFCWCLLIFFWILPYWALRNTVFRVDLKNHHTYWEQDLKIFEKNSCIRTWKFNWNFNQTSFLLERQQQGSHDTRIDRYWLILVALPPRHSLLFIWRIKAKPFKTLIEKNDKSSRFKNFCQFCGFALHWKSAESVESWKNFVILADKRLDYFLTGLELISNLQTLVGNWIRSPFHLTNNNRLHMIQELIDID